jgi:acyl-CoA thioesterase-1
MRFLHVPFLVSALVAAPAREVRTLVFFGDSLTAGYGLSRAEAYPGRIEARIRAAGLPWRVVNAGVSGDTSAGAKARLEWVLRQKPDLVFLCIGANDGLRGLPPKETERNLRAILERARKDRIRVVMAGLMLPENFGPEHREAFRSLFPRLAKEFRLPFLPFLLEGVALRSELNQEDGIHPNALGAARVADTVWKVIEPELRKPR